MGCRPPGADPRQGSSVILEGRGPAVVHRNGQKCWQHSHNTYFGYAIRAIPKKKPQAQSGCHLR